MISRSSRLRKEADILREMDKLSKGTTAGMQYTREEGVRLLSEFQNDIIRDYKKRFKASCKSWNKKDSRTWNKKNCFIFGKGSC